MPAACLVEKPNNGIVRIAKNEMQHIINNVYPIVLIIHLAFDEIKPVCLKQIYNYPGSIADTLEPKNLAKLTGVIKTICRNIKQNIRTKSSGMGSGNKLI